MRSQYISLHHAGSENPIRTLVSHVNVVAADFEGLIVQRLGDVPEEVHQEFQSLLHIGIRQPSVADSLGIVGDSGHNTSAGGAVPVKVHIAGGRRVILGIYVMEPRRESACGCGAIGISPGGDVCQV